MVGSTQLFCKIRDHLLQDSQELRFGYIVGMAGVGKTALANKIIQDPSIRSNFECCIFVRLGPEFEWKEFMQAILAQMPDGDKLLMEEEDLHSNYSRYFVRKTLKDRKCLVVLDDFWNRGPWNIYSIFGDPSSQSVILFTTRIANAPIKVPFPINASTYQVPFLDKEESWELLRREIFRENRCPYELEKAGKTIAENCEGLPLLILAVGSLLSQAERTPEYWSTIAANKKNSIFVGAYERVSDVVYPSYYYLEQHLKACFLYLGAFPQNDEVRVSRLINLWSADGFLGVPYTVLKGYAYNLLRDVVYNNVSLGTQYGIVGRRLKACSLHSVFWFLCKQEAGKEKFLHVLDTYKDARKEGIETQRRLSFYNNTILSIKEVSESIASISAVHSLMCTGPYHQYEVPICLDKLTVVKVLDALTIRFYEFPIEVLKLFHLRYLGLTCNGNLPPSIPIFWGLQCLILNLHQSIKCSSISHSYLPMEIWYLQDLEHLQIVGRNLPDPPPCAVLRKLLILLDVGAHTCTKRVLASIPNLEKLRVQIELMPVATEHPRFCNDVSCLQQLKSLQFVVVNPELMFEVIGPSAALVSFSRFIRKLTLSGSGYHWKDMHSIAELCNLEELKLKCYAFQGEKWEVKEGEFKSLVYLLMEDTDIVRWTGNFQALEYLTVKNCYKLLEFPQLPSLKEIRVVDCNPSTGTCATQMGCSVSVGCSWLDDRKHS